MRETEIVKGLAQAKRNMFAKGMVPRYADGVVPPEEPSILGFIKDRSRATMQAILPGAPAMAQDAVLKNQGMLGNAARGLRDHQNNMDAQIKEATGFATGTPFIHGPGTGTSDSVPAMLSKGEAVLPAKTVQHIGPNNIARLIEQTNGVAPKRGLSGRMDSGSIGSDNWTHATSGGTDSGTIGKFADGTVPYNGVANPDVDKAITSGVPLGIAAAGLRSPAPVAAPSMVESATTGAKNLYNSAASKVGGLYDSMRNRTPTSPLPTIDPTMAEAAPVAEAAPIAEAAKPNFAARVAAGIPGAEGTAAVGRGIAAAGGSAFNAAKYVLGKVATPLAVAQEVNRVGGTMLDPNKTSGQKTLSAVQGAGRFAAGAAGASVGAELGLLGGPAAPFTVPIGGVVGGIGGYFGGSKLINGVRNSLGIADPDAGSRTLMDRAVNPNNGGAGAPTTAPTTAAAATTAPQPQAQSGTIGGAASAGAGEIQNPQAPLQNATASQARNLDSAIRNRTIDSTDFQPGTGVVVANGNGGSAPRAIQINDNRGGIQRQVQEQDTQPAGPYDEVRKMLAASKFSPSDSWQDRADKKSMRQSAMQLSDTVNNEQNQKNTRYSTDRGFDAAIMNKNIARAQYQRELGNDNGKRIDDQLNTLSQKSDSKGGTVTDPVLRADYERKVIGTYGKNGITKNDIPQDQFSEFLNYYEANKQDPGVLQKLDNFVKQRKTVTSNDVTGARDIGAEPGVLVDSTVQANGNRVPTNLRHGQNILGIGPANADLRDLDKATRAHVQKYGF